MDSGHEASNNLYIKSVSPLATEDSVKELFRQTPLEGGSNVADDLVSVSFIPYPQSSQKYCRLTFASSIGVTSAIALNGQHLNGVPVDFSVIDPGLASNPDFRSEAPTSRLPPNAIALQQALNPAALLDLFSEAISLPGGAMSSPQVQNLQSMLMAAGGLNSEHATALMLNLAGAAQIAQQADLGASAAQATILAAISKTQSSLGGGALETISAISQAAKYPRETEAQQLARTLFVGNVPDQWDENVVVAVLRDFLGLGSVNDRRIDRLAVDNSRFALVEFTSAEAVEVAIHLPEDRRTLEVMQPGVTVPDPDTPDFQEQQAALNESVVLKLEPARATVRPREPDNVSYTLRPNQASVVPIAYQSLSKLNLEEKVARVRQIARRIEAGKSGRDNASDEDRRSSSIRKSGYDNGRKRRRRDDWWGPGDEADHKEGRSRDYNRHSHDSYRYERGASRSSDRHHRRRHSGEHHHDRSSRERSR